MVEFIVVLCPFIHDGVDFFLSHTVWIHQHAYDVIAQLDVRDGFLPLFLSSDVDALAKVVEVFFAGVKLGG